MTDLEPKPPEAANTEPTARKRKHSSTSKKPKPQSHEITIRSPPYTYIHLSLLSNSASSTLGKDTPLDDITARTYLTSALSQFLGLTGTAIPIDILKVEDKDCWIRVPRQDGRAVIEAVSGWLGDNVAWRVKGNSTWLSGLVHGDGRDLFED